MDLSFRSAGIRKGEVPERMLHAFPRDSILGTDLRPLDVFGLALASHRYSGNKNYRKQNFWETGQISPKNSLPIIFCSQLFKRVVFAFTPLIVTE